MEDDGERLGLFAPLALIGAWGMSRPAVGAARTLFEKIWDRHVVTEGPGGQSLLYVDRHLLHDGSFGAFARLARAGRSIRRPDLATATADHYVATVPGGIALTEPEMREKVESIAPFLPSRFSS